MAPLSLFLPVCALIASASAAIDTQLVGTWSTKSAKVITGPGFYNPINDSFIEPSHTGISYSFTADGFYEEAYYRAVANPTNPKCPQAIMQFQHGTVVMNSDLSLSLTPFEVDGRQLFSDPCTGDTATYTRYNQSETMAKWQVYTDPYTKLTRLDLYQFDGSPLNPLFLAYSPPQMLPTVTMNPTSTASSASSTSASKSKNKRSSFAEPHPDALNKNSFIHQRSQEERTPMWHRLDLGLVWWMGVAMIVFGGTAYLI